MTDETLKDSFVYSVQTFIKNTVSLNRGRKYLFYRYYPNSRDITKNHLPRA